METKMPRFREHIARMKAYNPPLEGRSAGDYLLLDFNEMTTETSPKVKCALREFIDSGRLQKYPEYGNVEGRIAEYAGVKSEQVMITNGSDQGIDIVFRAFLGEGDRVVIPSPSFAMFYQSAQIQGAQISEPTYREDMSFPLEEVLAAIDDSLQLLVVCNPNNPTGTPVSLSDLESMLLKARDTGVAVLHDEAYFEFAGITGKELVDEFDNLFILRTFSKQFGLASLRVGYAISQEQNIRELLKVRGPYDVNMLAKAAVTGALDDVDYMRRYVEEVMERSKPMLELFFRDHGVKYWPGAANYLLVKPRNQKKTVEFLKSSGILVRPRRGPNIDGTIRVSIGTMADTERFIQAYRKLLV
jgi:histidinol-phosphate aminotransferase